MVEAISRADVLWKESVEGPRPSLSLGLGTQGEGQCPSAAPIPVCATSWRGCPSRQARALAKHLSCSSETRQEGGLPGCSPTRAGLSPPPPHAPGPSCRPSRRPAGPFSPSVVRLLWRSWRKLSEVQPLTLVDQLVH